MWVMEGFLTRMTTSAKGGSLRTEIPPDEIFGPNQSILDRKLGLSVTFPSGWTIRSATRAEDLMGNGVEFAAPETPAALLRLNYRADRPGEFPASSGWMSAKPTNPADVDSWLRNHAQLVGEQRITNRVWAPMKYKNRPASIVLRTIGGHRAVSWSGDFTKKDQSWTENFTIILGEKVRAQFWLQTPTASLTTVLPSFEEMVETTRLP
jgi:hypothetical protein